MVCCTLLYDEYFVLLSPLYLSFCWNMVQTLLQHVLISFKNRLSRMSDLELALENFYILRVFYITQTHIRNAHASSYNLMSRILSSLGYLNPVFLCVFIIYSIFLSCTYWSEYLSYNYSIDVWFPTHYCGPFMTPGFRNQIFTYSSS